MNIELKRIKIRDLVKGYFDDPEQGVRAYDGLLDVRPAYQREFVYKEKVSQSSYPIYIGQKMSVLPSWRACSNWHGRVLS